MIYYSEPGEYQITYKAVDECGNEDVHTMTVIVNEAPPTGN